MVLKTNVIYCGDCKDVLAQFPERSVDLIYVDPPFFSNRQYEVFGERGLINLKKKKIYNKKQLLNL